LAAGRVVYAREHSEGFAILVEHRSGWLSYYNRLQHMFVQRTDIKPRETRVNAGDVLGYLGATRAGPLVPLRFELWRCNADNDFIPIDPLLYVARWLPPKINSGQSVTPHSL